MRILQRLKVKTLVIGKHSAMIVQRLYKDLAKIVQREYKHSAEIVQR